MTDTEADVRDRQDRVWLQLVAEGGAPAERALEGLFRQYRRPLLRFLAQRGLDAGAAEDLVQETFVRVMRGARGFRGDARVSSWIYQIARNLHLDQLRRSRPEDTYDEDAWMRIEAEVEAPADSGEAAEAMDDCVRRGYADYAAAYPQCAEALDKVVHLHWSTRDVAQFLQRTEGATREYLSQCRKKLRRFLEPCRVLLEES